MFEEKKRKFNIIYNSDKKKGYGEGYYIVYENYEGKPTFDSMYPIWEQNEQVDGVSVGIINKIKHLYDMGYVLDVYYNRDNIDNIF